MEEAFLEVDLDESFVSEVETTVDLEDQLFPDFACGSCEDLFDHHK